MWRQASRCLEIAAYLLLVLVTRCANYAEVFVGPAIVYSDADCYARMTRARMCFEHPGTVVRWHDFENFPIGVAPHTTAPFDYVIVALAEGLRPVSHRPLELAGALISPLLGLAAAAFFWWWLQAMRFRFRAAGLLLFAASPILVHGTELGRPDHQSLLLLTIGIGICAEWTLRVRPSRAWAIAGGLAWGLSLWVSLYEPLVLLAPVLTCRRVSANPKTSGSELRGWWIALVSMLALALLVERRVSLVAGFTGLTPLMANWLTTIGEMRSLSLGNEVWLQWCGYLLPVAPLLVVSAARGGKAPPFFLIVLLVAAFFLTIWQIRWGYFFVLIFAMALPALLSSWPERRCAAAVLSGVFLVSAFPILKAWDATIWPNESKAAERAEHRTEAVDLLDAAAVISRDEARSFIAPWWLSPQIAYRSRGRGVAGSSHESLAGIADTARFFISSDAEKSRAILAEHSVHWVIAYDDDRTLADAAVVLGQPIPTLPLGRTLVRTPSSAPAFLTPVLANATCTLYRVQNSLKSPGFP